MKSIYEIEEKEEIEKLDVVDTPAKGVRLDAVTPFESGAAQIFSAAEREAFEKDVARGKTSLKAPNLTHLGPEKGRLNRLYTVYAAAPTPENLNILMGEVERYARRITTGRGGDFAQYVSQSVTDYAPTDASLEVARKVWVNLPKFRGESLFSTWVFKISRNTAKDAVRSLINRRERPLHEWKDYSREGSGCFAGASGESANGEMEVTGGHKTALPVGRKFSHGTPWEWPDQRKVKLGTLLAGLSEQDRKIVHFVRRGYKPREIGEEFGKNAKWASNKINSLKKRLKKLAEERYPKSGVANPKSASVLVMKEDKSLPASQAAD